MAKQRSLHVSMKNFDWNFLGFGLCRAWITQWFLLPIALSDTWHIYTEMLYFLPGAIVCLALALFMKNKASKKARTLTFLLSAVFSLVGVILIILSVVESGVTIFAVGLLVCGIGAALLQTLWGDKFAYLPTSQATLYTVCAFFLSALMSLFARGAETMPAALFLFCLVPFGSFVLLYRGLRAGQWSGLGAEKQSDDVPEQHTLVNLGRFCVSIFVFVFVFNFAFRGLLSGSSLEVVGQPIRNYANVIVMAVLLVLVLTTGRFNRMGLYRISFPILIGALLLSLFIPYEYVSIASIIAAVGYKLFDVLFWCVLVGIAHNNRCNIWGVFGLGMFANLGGMGLGMAAGWAFSLFSVWQEFDRALMVCILMFALVIVVILILPESLVAQFISHGSKKGTTSLGDSLADRCLIIAQQCGLTTREREVLGLLAQGRTQVVIAKKLGISEGTAHTHIVHVYQKTNVHSQQELIDIVERVDAENLM
ncbi:MAG: LuxR family transcriptional regulator [Raoultibacter sp.]